MSAEAKELARARTIGYLVEVQRDLRNKGSINGAHFVQETTHDLVKKWWVTSPLISELERPVSPPPSI